MDGLDWLIRDLLVWVGKSWGWRFVGFGKVEILDLQLSIILTESFNAITQPQNRDYDNSTRITATIIQDNNLDEDPLLFFFPQLNIISLIFQQKHWALTKLLVELRELQELYIIMEQDKLNLTHYVSVLSHLTFRACEIAKECAENPLLKKYEKGVNDPVTEADYKIQTMLIRGIRHFFPKLRIVGEETTEYEGHIHLDLSAVPLNNFPEALGCEESHPIDQYCVWIDPIDNTKGFINGTLDCVTVLVGLSWNKKAELGIVGLPYVRENGNILFRPQVQVGSVTGKKAFSSLTEGSWNQIFQAKLNKPLKFSISDTRGNSDTVKQLLEKHSAELVRVGGSGKKIIQVVKGETDALLYLKAANHKWDSCAGEAIVLALGGFFSDSDGAAIVYDPHAKSTVNEKGNICVIDADLFHSIINHISKI